MEKPFDQPQHEPEAGIARGLGVAGVGLGSVALLAAWVPLAGLTTLWVSLPGALLSAIGLVMGLAAGRGGARWPLRGIAVNAIAIALPFASLMILGCTAEMEWERSTEEFLQSEYGRRALAESRSERPPVPAPAVPPLLPAEVPLPTPAP